MDLNCHFYFQDPVYLPPHAFKSKKSFVDKLNRTLDKLNPKSPPGPSVASTAAWIYPTAFYHPQVYPVQYYNYLDVYEYPVTSPPATRRGNICACYGTVRSKKCKTCSSQIKPSLVKRPGGPNESNLKRLTSHIESPPTLKKSPLSLKQSPFKEYLDFSGQKKATAAPIKGHLEDEWHDYWGDRGVTITEETESPEDESEDSFTSHLKVSSVQTIHLFA